MATSGKSSAGPRPRILRIGVLLSGKIVEERLIRDRGDVTVGQSAKNTFSIPLETLPREWTLFKSHEGRYGLSFTSAMDGRLSDGDRVQTLEAARSGGSADAAGPAQAGVVAGALRERVADEADPNVWHACLP